MNNGLEFGNSQWNLGTVAIILNSHPSTLGSRTIQLSAFLHDNLALLLVTLTGARSQVLAPREDIIWALCMGSRLRQCSALEVIWASIVPHLSSAVLCHSLVWDHFFCGGCLYMLLCWFFICIIKSEPWLGCTAGLPTTGTASPISRQLFE